MPVLAATTCSQVMLRDQDYFLVCWTLETRTRSVKPFPHFAIAPVSAADAYGMLLDSLNICQLLSLWVSQGSGVDGWETGG